MASLEDTLKYRFNLSDSDIEGIKALFIERIDEVITSDLFWVGFHEAMRKDSWMTGQEWYDRFKREYHLRADWIEADPIMGNDAGHDVLLCARLAAGLTEESS